MTPSIPPRTWLSSLLLAPTLACAGIPGTIVDTLVDENDGIGTNGVSLRDAIAANLGVPIQFDPSLDGGVITLTNGELSITNSVEIDADTGLSNGITIDGDESSRIFNISSSGALSIECLTIQNGSAIPGAGVLTNGVLFAVDTTFRNNISTGVGGAVFLGAGQADFVRCTITGNTASNGGALWQQGTTSDASFDNCTIAQNSSAAGFTTGGIIALGGVMDIVHSTISGNSGDSGGGGLYLQNPVVISVAYSIIAGNGADGTAAVDILYNGGTLTAPGPNLIGVNDSATAIFPTGPLVGTSSAPVSAKLWPPGPYGGKTHTMPPQVGSLAIDAATGSSLTGDQRGFTRPQGTNADLGAAETGPLILVDTNVDENDGSGSGLGTSLRDAINEVTTPGTIIAFDPKFFCGGDSNTIDLSNGELGIPNRIFSLDASEVCGVTINAGGNARVINNGSGGTLALESFSIAGGGNVSDGGGIRNKGPGSTFVINNSSFFDNSAFTAGGGVFNGGEATLLMVNSTVYNNSADGFSGGVENNGTGSTATILNSTIVGNTATGLSGSGNNGGLGSNGNPILLGNTVCAFNSGVNRPDLGGAGGFTFLAPNFIRNNKDVSSVFPAGNPNPDGNFVGTDASPFNPLLVGDLGGSGDAFINNGGATPTFLPSFGSPLIDAGSNTLGVFTDQRGVARVGNADIGATEPNYNVNSGGTPTPPFADVTTPGDTIALFPLGTPVVAGKEAPNAIDNNNTSEFGSTNAVNVGLDVTPIVGFSSLVGLRLTMQTSGNIAQQPYNFLLLGSNDGTCFEQIASGSVPGLSAGATHEVLFAGPSSPYLHFRILFPETNFPSSGNLLLGEIQLLGTPTNMDLRILQFNVSQTLNGSNQRPWDMSWLSIPGKNYSLSFNANVTGPFSLTPFFSLPASADGFVTGASFLDGDLINNFFQVTEVPAP